MIIYLLFLHFYATINMLIFNFSEFVNKSLVNYKEFERQKDLDLMKILKEYVAFQTKYAQKVCIHFKLIDHLNIVCR